MQEARVLFLAGPTLRVKIIEEKVLPLRQHLQVVRPSRFLDKIVRVVKLLLLSVERSELGFDADSIMLHPVLAWYLLVT